MWPPNLLRHLQVKELSLNPVMFWVQKGELLVQALHLYLLEHLAMAGYDGTQGHGYVAVPSTRIDLATHITNHPHTNMLSKFEHHLIPSLFLDSGCASLAAYKAAVKDPDILLYKETMCDVNNLDEWKATMHKKISQLEVLKCWEEVDISDAKAKIIPGTWVFKIKHSLDGKIKKYKARFCCHGNLQEDIFESFTPVVLVDLSSSFPCVNCNPWLGNMLSGLHECLHLSDTPILSVATLAMQISLHTSWLNLSMPQEKSIWPHCCSTSLV